VITISAYTSGENFRGASRVVSSLGEPPDEHVSLAELEGLCERAR
jgi:hypothetical protein